MDTTQLTEQLKPVVDWLKAALDTSGQFVQEQSPLVVQEYIAYVRATSTLYVVFGVLIIVVAALLMRTVLRYLRSGEETSEATDAVHVVLGVIAIVLFIAGPVAVVNHTDDCLKAWCAPRVLILEKVSDLLH